MTRSGSPGRKQKIAEVAEKIVAVINVVPVIRLLLLLLTARGTGPGKVQNSTMLHYNTEIINR